MGQIPVMGGVVFRGGHGGVVVGLPVAFFRGGFQPEVTVCRGGELFSRGSGCGWMVPVLGAFEVLIVSRLWETMRRGWGKVRVGSQTRLRMRMWWTIENRGKGLCC